LTRLVSTLALAALAGAAACGDRQPSSPAATDRFAFPTGLALLHTPRGCTGGAPGCTTQLVVASSNFDLRFDEADGGTVAVVDVEAALAAQPDRTRRPPPLTPAVARFTRIASFAGELALVDEASCPGWESGGRAPQALVPSRSRNALFRVDLGADGPSCPEGCALPLEQSFADPYGVAVACGLFPAGNGGTPAPQSLAFVTYLRTPSALGFVSRVDLATGEVTERGVDTALLPTVPSHSLFYDPGSTRLYVTGRFAGTTPTPLRWLTLRNPEDAAQAISFSDALRGGELRSFALSTDRRRAYLGFRLYDADEATRLGARPAGDLGGALVVVDFAESATDAAPAGRVLQVVPLDRGASEVRVVPRPGRADLVAVTSVDDATLTLYDDDVGAVARVIGVCGPEDAGASPVAPAPCAPGKPRLGAQPFGIAVEPRAGGLARLYVGSFDRSWVNVIELDPARPAAERRAADDPVAPGQPYGWWRIGPERP
jgi:hypothetical protein